MLLGDAVGPGLIIRHNLFRGGNIFSVPATNGSTVAVSGTLIADNSFTSDAAGSRATLSLTQTAATAWAFDFCPLLVFPTIAQAAIVSVVAASGHPQAIVRPWSGCTVNVETDVAMTGTITVTADSSALSKLFV